MLIVNRDSYIDRHGWATIGGIVGAAFTAPRLATDTIGQADLVRNIKGEKPILKGDTFEKLKETMPQEVVEEVTKTKKLFYNPLLKRLGIATLGIAGGIIIGSLLDNAHRNNTYMP